MISEEELRELRQELEVAKALYENSCRALQVAEDKILDLEVQLRKKENDTLSRS